MSELQRITIKPEQCAGRPCIRGLRVRVNDVLDLLAAGASREEILEDYPYLEAGDSTAVLEYAAKQSDHTGLLIPAEERPSPAFWNPPRLSDPENLLLNALLAEREDQW